MAKEKDKDDRGFIKKTLDGDVQDLSVVDGLDAAGAVTGFIPGKVGDFASAPIEAAKGAITSTSEYEDDCKALGRDLELEAKNSDNRALRRKLEELDGRAAEGFKKYGTVGVGSMVGGTVGTTVVPVPILGSMGGAWIGGTVAEQLYDEVVKTQDQDAIGLVIEMREMRKRKEVIPPEMVFAALAANLPDHDATKVEDGLAALAGTRKFADAIQQGNMGAITRLMRSRDTEVRQDTRMPVDLVNPNKTAAEQYADLINDGSMDPLALLCRSDMPSVSELVQRTMPQPVAVNNSAPQAPKPQKKMAFVRPDLASMVAYMNKIGLMVDVDESGKLKPMSVGTVRNPQGKSHD